MNFIVKVQAGSGGKLQHSTAQHGTVQYGGLEPGASEEGLEAGLVEGAVGVGEVLAECLPCASVDDDLGARDVGRCAAEQEDGGRRNVRLSCKSKGG